MWKLVIEDDEGKRTVVPLSREDYSIGRQEGNTIRLTERNVSRQHGRIRRQRTNGVNGTAPHDTFILEDRESYNGLYVNGLRVAESQELQSGDLIQIGDYRIVLQDDATAAPAAGAAAGAEATATEIEITTDHEPGRSPDAKATLVMGSANTAFRGQAQTLTERPARFVMLVGPTPGVEYPLDRALLTIGRAEDATISVNHNSVSRLHCEIHALGDGRFEIVDKGSSNGVRVNSVELRRSIIEVGDVIELGDVRFKFVGAGQVFVAGPNESQQLTAIGDREPDARSGTSRKGLGGYAIPIIGAGVIGAIIIVVFVVALKARSGGGDGTMPIGQAPDDEQALVTNAKKSCSIDDCETSHQQVTTGLSPKSPWRDTADFQQIEATWADSVIKKAAAENDPSTKRALLNHVITTPTVDAARKKQAQDMLQAMDQAAAPPPSSTDQPGVALNTAPVPVTPPPPTTVDPTPSTPPSTPSSASAKPSGTDKPGGHSSTTPTTPTSPATTAPKAESPAERARKALLDNRPQDARAILEPRVRYGHSTDDEARLLKEACKALGDRACVDDVKAKYPNMR